jgi:hypothetical protein
MTAPLFPQSTIQWLDRVDELNTVFANDPNSIAAEVGAVENTLGVMPQVEKLPIVGTGTTTYQTVDARLSDMLNGNQVPVLAISSPQQYVKNRQSAGDNYGEFNNYTNVSYDPFGMWNGTDIKIQANGWYLVTAEQSWDWWSTGYNGMSLWIDGSMFRQDLWHWDFVGNTLGSYWYPTTAEKRPGSTDVSWQGVLQQGQRIRIMSENGCADTPHRAFNQSLAISFVRSVAANVPSSTS